MRRCAVAVNGVKVASKIVSDLASLIFSAGEIQDAHQGLRFLIHLSGVLFGGEISWASLFGDGFYVDPYVLRLFGQAHQFCRGRDLLTSSGKASSCHLARLVGTRHRGGVEPKASAVPHPSRSGEELAFLDAMVALQLDDHAPAQTELKHLARMAARAEAASRSPSSPSDGVPPLESSWSDGPGVAAFGNGDAVGRGDGDSGGSGDSGGGSTSGSSAGGSPATRLLAGFNPPGLFPFVFDRVRRPLRRVASKASLCFIDNVLDRKRRGPISLLRNVPKAAVLFSSMTFNQRGIQDPFSRWGTYQLIIVQKKSGQLPERCQWPLSVVVPTRFLTPKAAKKLPAATILTAPLQSSREEPDDDQAEEETDITPVPKRFVDPAVLIELRAIFTDESHCKQEEEVAPILLLLNKEPRPRSCMMAKVFRVDAQAGKRKQQRGRRKSAAKSTGASASVAVALAPQTGGGNSGAGSGGGNSAARAAPPGLWSVAAARAIARRAAAGVGAAAKRTLEAPAVGGLVKRTRLSGWDDNRARSHEQDVVDGTCDLLDARSVMVAYGVADVGRPVLHTGAAPSEFVVIQLKAVAPSRATIIYPHAQQVSVEQPAVTVRLMRDTVGTLIVSNRASLLSV